MPTFCQRFVMVKGVLATSHSSLNYLGCVELEEKFERAFMEDLEEIGCVILNRPEW